MSKNLSNAVESRVITEENRIPMGLPESTLGVPEIEGHVVYWFIDSPGRIPKAMRAGWEFVAPEEVQLNQHGFANDPASDGNSDLGNRVSVFGAVSEHGKTQMLYLMKIRKDWYDRDMAGQRQATDRVADALKGQRIGVENETGDDAKYRYGSFNGNLKRPGRF